ncbi:MAG TPA: hypothetical protein ENK60_04340, partial [Anaerolineae bacterium]|nr:hypothetical protein [Anaerolineae bacterium]
MQVFTRFRLILTSMSLAFLLVITLAMMGMTSWAQGPVGTSFTFQGRLLDGGQPAEGLYDFKFALFDAPSGG